LEELYTGATKEMSV